MPAIKKFYDDTIPFGTQVTLAGSRGVVLSLSVKKTVKEENITDGEGALISVVQYDPRVEVSGEILLDPTGTIPAVGAEETIASITDVILTEVVQIWSSGTGKKLRISGMKSLV